MFDLNKLDEDPLILSSMLGQKHEWRKWAKEIPFIQWPADWKVKAVPPFCGAIIRYVVETPKARVSIYLDCYDQLGCFGEPYWEAYPVEGDTARFEMSDIEGLLKVIASATESI